MKRMVDQGDENIASVFGEALELSSKAYAQEEKRADILLTKSDYLQKYIVAVFAVLNAVAIFAGVKDGTEVSRGFWLLFICSIILLLYAMYKMLDVQMIVHVKFFQLVKVS